jgi:hypothetical protein
MSFYAAYILSMKRVAISKIPITTLQFSSGPRLSKDNATVTKLSIP